MMIPKAIKTLDKEEPKYLKGLWYNLVQGGKKKNIENIFHMLMNPNILMILNTIWHI